jgi:cullin 1
VEGQLEAIHAEFPDLLKKDQREDLGRLYGLVARLHDAFGQMKESLEEHIASEGADAIREHGTACLNVTFKVFNPRIP